MAQLVIANAAQIKLYWRFQGQDFINSFGALGASTATINQALANTIGSAIKTGAATTAFLADLTTQITLANVGVRSLVSPNLPEFRDAGAAVAGTGTGDPLPPQTAMCITLRTALAGKSFRGRVYLGGFTEAANDVNGAALAAVATRAIAFVNGVDAACTASGLPLAVLSRPTDLTPEIVIAAKPGKAGFATDITSVQSLVTNWETQRRRRL